MRQKKILKFVTNILLLLSGVATLNAQVHPDFTITKLIKTTSVKDQQKTGTCWCFATISFLETEALRLGKPAFDLSEMYIVKYAYADKAKKYVRYHGKANFSEGGLSHDVLNVIRKHGVVPETSYNGLNYGGAIHDHTEMQNMLKGVVKSVIPQGTNKPSPIWSEVFNKLVDSYLGTVPTEVKYDNKNYTPLKFSKDIVGINPDDYIEITSYKDYPYYKLVDLEIPDNWSHDLYYNIPINDFMKIIDNALINGYSIAWDGDVSEEDFNPSAGTAALSIEESDGIIVNGVEVMRQKTFDDYSTTDDHLMHVTGLAKDRNNINFYLVKNSNGENSNKYGGYLYMSKWYMQLKTVAIMVHKDAIPKDIRKKLKIKGAN